MDSAHSETELKLYCENLMPVRPAWRAWARVCRPGGCWNATYAMRDAANSLAARNIVCACARTGAPG